jgi:hypothetical protein
MPLIYKLTADKKAIEINDKGLPVVIDTDKDNEELGLDAIHLFELRPQLENQVKQLKESSQKNKEVLNLFKGVKPEEIPKWVTDAKKALETVDNLDKGQLVKAKEVEDIKRQAQENMQAEIEGIRQSYEEKIQSFGEAQAKDADTIYKLMVKDQFVNSKFVDSTLAMTTVGAQRYFKDNFKVEENEKGERIVVGYFDDGSKVYSKARAGELADFEEALSLLVEKSPEKDSLLKGKSQSGTDARPNHSRQTSGNKSPDEMTGAENIAAGLSELMGTG